MQSANWTTINQPLQWDDVVNFAPFGALGVNRQDFLSASPSRGAEFNVLSAVVEASGVGRVIRPPIPSGCVDFGLSRVVCGLSLPRMTLSEFCALLVFIAPPCVLIIAVFADVFTGSAMDVMQAASFALVAYGLGLLVILGTRLFDAATGADFRRKRNSAHSDIIALWGDVKPGEFGER